MRSIPKACWRTCVLSLHLQRCARVEGVWDDSNNVWEGGGSCISQQEAAQKLLDDPAGLEQISLQLSNDGSLASFSPEGLPVSADIRWALLSRRTCSWPLTHNLPTPTLHNNAVTNTSQTHPMDGHCCHHPLANIAASVS